jgi:hypothetical protein
MKETTKEMTKTALIADNNPQATSQELLDRGIELEKTNAIWFTKQELMMLEEILYKQATVCTLIADAHLREGNQALMIAMDDKARKLEDLAYKVGMPLDKEYIERNAYR